MWQLGLHVFHLGGHLIHPRLQQFQAFVQLIDLTCLFGEAFGGGLEGPHPAAQREQKDEQQHEADGDDADRDPGRDGHAPTLSVRTDDRRCYR